MADTLVIGSVGGSVDLRQQVYGPYYINTTEAVVIYGNSSNSLMYVRTDDGGATWSAAQTIQTGTIVAVACWLDKETPGDTGDLLNIVWLNDSGTDTFHFATLDISASTGTGLGTIQTIDATITCNGNNTGNHVAVTKTVSGNIIAAYTSVAGGGSSGTYRSTDKFASNDTIGDVFEDNTEQDKATLFPANTTDDDDVAAIFLDNSTNEVSVKMYDNSVDTTWTEYTTTFVFPDVRDVRPIDGAVRHSDGAILAASHQNDDNSVDDIMVTEVIPNSISAPSVDPKTNIYDNTNELGGIAIFINNQTGAGQDDVYVTLFEGGTWGASVDCIYQKSTDDMGTWTGSAIEYSDNSAPDDFRWVQAGRMVGDAGGFFQPVFFNDDTTELYVNLDNDIPFAAAGGDITVTPSALTLTLAQLAETVIPSLAVAPSVLTLALAELAPVTTGDVVIASSVQSLTLAQPVMSIIGDVAIALSAQALTLAQPSPVVTVDALVTPPALALALTQESVAVVGDVTVTPTVQALILTEQALTVDVSGDALVTPPALALALTQESVAVVGDAAVTPTVQALTLAQAAPVVSSGIIATVAAQALALTQESVAVVGDVTITLNTLTLALTEESPAISTGDFFAAPVLSLTLTEGAISVVGDVAVAPDAQSLALTLETPVASVDVSVAVAAQALALTLNASTVLPSIDIQPAALTLALTQEALAVVGDVTVSVAVQTLALGQAAPYFIIGIRALALTLAQPAIVITGDVEVSFGGFVQAMTLNAPRPNVQASSGTEAIVANVRTFAISEYAAFAFNSMAKFNGKYLYADVNGIYEGGGNNDDGLDIIASYKTGTVDINATEVQKLRDAYIGFRGDGDIQLFAVGNEVNSRAYNITNNKKGDTLHEQREKFERGIRDNHFAFGISNINGSSFAIKEARILTEPVRKRR
ncbi:MAG: hypothetical protein GY774_10595 [Planctomycetes bacterium]|nr:hypothetical protein [Planctomycetota bacterium]